MTDQTPHVHVLGTGGTIANPPDVEGYLPIEEVIDVIPELDGIADLTADDVASVASQSVTPEILLDLHERCTDVLASSSPDGFVVTSGSNALEEIAFFLHLTLDTDRPVVHTAAQRNHDTVGNDGDRNLIDAVRVAGDPAARGRGVLAVVNDEIHSARDVRKQVTSRPDAWSSGDLGDVGFTDKHGRVGFYRDVARTHTVDSAFGADDFDPEVLRRVEVVHASLGADGSLVEAAVENGAEGFVVAAYPTGSPATPDGYDGQNDALLRAADDGIPVVITNRGSDGWTYAAAESYQFPSFISGDTLSPSKARLLLALALSKTRDFDEIQRYFHEY